MDIKVDEKNKKITLTFDYDPKKADYPLSGSGKNRLVVSEGGKIAGTDLKMGINIYKKAE